MGPGGQKWHEIVQNRRKMKGKVENVKCPKMDSPDLIPEGFVRVQGTPGDPWGPLKHQISLNFRVFRAFGEIPLFSLLAPISLLKG